MIAYRFANGFASDLRRVTDDYQAGAGELTLPGFDLPPIESLHDPQAVAARAAAKAAADDREAFDISEVAQAKIDAQIQSDLNMTTAEVNSTVDTVFSGFTAPQRAFLKRLVRIVLAAARRVLR